MYLEHWELQKVPFGNVPAGSSSFYRSPQHEEALQRLHYVIEQRKGVAMLTGEVGCGKTTVIRALSDSLNKDTYQFRLISNPALRPTELIKAILLKLAGQSTHESKTDMLDRLHRHLYENADNGIRTVLAVDEAHVIGNQAALDELRMLLNLQSGDEFLITLILLGQPPLLKNISELQPLKERISIKFNLEPFDMHNTLHYVVHRLKWAGAKRGIFSREAIMALYEFSEGLPLRINNLGDRCLLLGLMRQARMVDSQIVQDAIEDMEL
jgi:type II secretory pathway predicted ATPase ExeA